MNIHKAAFEFAAGKVEQLPPTELPEIVFSGRSNVGKSSLINKLLNRKALARVSATPGKTGTINFYGLPECKLVDLPGYGYAKVSASEKMRWAQLVEGYFQCERNIGLVVQIVDFRHKPTADDFHMIDFLWNAHIPFLIAATKSDKLNKTQRAAQMELYEQILKELPGVSFLPFSSENGEGVEELRARIDQICAQDTLEEDL